MWLVVAQRIALQFVFDIVYFPVWWYTAGVRHAFLLSKNLFLSGNDRLAPFLWLKNIFVPMFGQYDLEGRITSFFMRLVNVVVRTILLAMWFCLVVLVFVAWFVIPVYIVLFLVGSLGA